VFLIVQPDERRAGETSAAQIERLAHDAPHERLHVFVPAA